MESTEKNEEVPKDSNGYIQKSVATLLRLPAIVTFIKGGGLPLPFVESSSRNDLKFITALGDS